VIQTILDALSYGGLYGLAALGIGLVFGVMRLINFAHGELIAIGAYLLVVTVPNVGLPLGLLIAVTGTAILALLMEVGVFKRLRHAGPAVLLIASFGVSVFLQRMYEVIFGALPVSAQVAPWMNGVIQFGETTVTRGTIITIVLALGLLGAMWFFIERTTLGLQIRAASSDFNTARLLGVRSNRVLASAFVASGVLAAAVGFVAVTQRGSVDPLFGINITILALVGTVIGGLGSLQGAAVGGFAVGATISLLNSFLGNYRVYTYTWLFLLVIIVLLVRPGGIFSSKALKERV
jgi:branched-chain amino acid transport system permease protein